MKFTIVPVLLLAALACSEAAPRDAPAQTDAPGPAYRVVINEVLPGNHDGQQDESGDREDWLELYNGTDEAVDLSGWTLVDASGEDPWMFADDSRIEPGGWLAIWCDDEDDDGPFHANFKLSAGGDEVSMHDAGGDDVDAVRFEAVADDVSWARLPDGGGDWGEAIPTFDAANAP